MMTKYEKKSFLFFSFFPHAGFFKHCLIIAKMWLIIVILQTRLTEFYFRLSLTSLRDGVTSNYLSLLLTAFSCNLSTINLTRTSLSHFSEAVFIRVLCQFPVPLRVISQSEPDYKIYNVG